MNIAKEKAKVAQARIEKAKEMKLTKMERAIKRALKEATKRQRAEDKGKRVNSSKMEK